MSIIPKTIKITIPFGSRILIEIMGFTKFNALNTFSNVYFLILSNTDASLCSPPRMLSLRLL